MNDERPILEESLTSAKKSQSRGLRILGGVGAILAVILVMLGFAQLFNTERGRSSANISVTISITQPHMVTWQRRTPAVSLLQGGGNPNFLASPPLAFAASDSNTVYQCVSATKTLGNTLHLWVTHDGAQHWQALPDLHASAPAGACFLAVDDTDPQTLALTIPVDTQNPSQIFCGPCAVDKSINLVSHDGGITWQSVVMTQPLIIAQLATWHQYIYAILTAVAHDASPYYGELVVSDDGLRTWQLVSSLSGNGSAPFAGDATTPYQFWLNPTTGGLLVENDFFTFGTLALWTSNNTGKSWKRILYLPNLQNRQLNLIAVQSPIGNRPWHICIVAYGCIGDSGQTWKSLAGLQALPNQSSFFAITDDGSILTDGQASSATASSGEGRPDTIYGLSAQGRVWTRLGVEPPGGAVLYIPGSNNHGALWVLPYNPAVADAQGHLFVAAYP